MTRIPFGAASGSRRPVTAVAALACAVVIGALAGCGGGSQSNTPAGTPSAPVTGSFSGLPPSALASAASSAVASAKASASAAVSSAAARASEFEASVDADTARASETAKKALANVQGSGNATSEVAMSGFPKAQTGGVLAVLVRITNKTNAKASYAVQVDFVDKDGKVVETRYVGAENLAPGASKEPIAFSRQSVSMDVTAKLAKAQRY
ncbi:hypothetical protein FNH09_30400 [Streptomyces adustus]|uniref:DUF3426 domain-containing protein n=1 Tax=Streptomyces adustus TaxID=1609272 RepID=A0A5N8VMX2_9ACTN|nr:hypothetical protein [Streptomyces adustus]MPY35388.1 hypothetical protein [Streptomyces adustus]